jgi:hypothetical protein
VTNPINIIPMTSHCLREIINCDAKARGNNNKGSFIRRLLSHSFEFSLQRPDNNGTRNNSVITHNNGVEKKFLIHLAGSYDKARIIKRIIVMERAALDRNNEHSMARMQ